MTHSAQRTNRRQFLEESMLAAAALASAGPAELLWDEPAPARSTLDQLGVAVIGVRGRGHTHLGFFAGRRDTRVLYVCDVDQEVGAARSAQVAKRQGGPPPTWVADLRRVLDDPRVDIVSIATPHHWHAVAAGWAMQAGKDVYLEKPVSHHLREGRRLVQIARQCRCICQSGMQARSNPGMREAVQFVQRGGIGDVQQARAICYKPRTSIGPRGLYPVPRHINYDLWLGPAATTPLGRAHFHHDWHWQWPYGNGELGHQGLHPLDICRWGLQLPTICDAVVSWGGRFAHRDAAHTTNTQVAAFDFGAKSIIVETRGLPSGPYREVQVGVIFTGTDGAVVMTGQDRGAAFDPEGRTIREFCGGGGTDMHFRNFLHAVRRRSCAELHADIEEGHVTSALVHLANLSYRLGRRTTFAAAPPQFAGSASCAALADAADRMRCHLRANGVDLPTASFRLGARLVCDPVHETILNHAPANALLSRDYRRPFVLPETGTA